MEEEEAYGFADVTGNSTSEFRHEVPRFDSEAVLTKHGVFWIGGTLQFSGSPRDGGGHFQAEEAERIHTDATE